MSSSNNTNSERHNASEARESDAALTSASTTKAEATSSAHQVMGLEQLMAFTEQMQISAMDSWHCIACTMQAQATGPERYIALTRFMHV